MATQRTYIARKNQDVEFASGSFSGELELNGGAALADSDALTLGTSDDVSIQWDGTNLVIAAAADDSIIEFGDAAATQKSFDVKIYGNAANGADYFTFDAGASALLVGGDSRIDFTNATVAAANTDGGIIKAGTSAARVTEDTADMKFVAMYFDNGATSGDNRGMYLRLYLTGAGGGGEALRVFTTVENVAAGTAHGAHVSLNFGATGTVTGQGIAGRNTLHIPDASLGGGNVTYAALQAEIYSDGSSSDPNGNLLSLLRMVNDGHADGKADVDDDAAAIEFIGFTAASGNMIGENTAGPNTLNFSNWTTLRIRVAGTDYYLPIAQTIAAV